MVTRRTFLACGSLIAAPALLTRPAAAESLDLGTHWKVIESSGQGFIFHGTWTRRPGTRTFDAVWQMEGRGDIIRDVIDFLDQRGEEITLHRRALNGQYQGSVTPDGRRASGRATWYGRGDAWMADIMGV